AEPRTATDCFTPLFKRQIGPAEYGLALVESVAHLNHLLARGEVTRTGKEGVWHWVTVG
ncbi:MAG: MBL fold metallo-hydrolase, partial [Rhodobacter sp.]|nr:MBL fold metallo-hydrolase [Rhodobacter sp.]